MAFPEFQSRYHSEGTLSASRDYAELAKKYGFRPAQVLPPARVALRLSALWELRFARPTDGRWAASWVDMARGSLTKHGDTACIER